MENFEIFVRSSFGKYRGTLSVRRKDGRADGVISFLHFSSDFTGTVSGEDFSFSGCLETPVGKIDYEARATIADGHVSGSAKTRLGTMSFSSKEGK